MNCKVFFILMINILYVCSSPYLNHIMTKRDRRYCGSHLTNTLSLVCGGRYPSLDKKSFEDGLSYHEYEGDYDAKDNEVDFPFLPKEFAKSLIPQKMRRGVFNECCQKPCSLDELKFYCAL